MKKVGVFVVMDLTSLHDDIKVKITLHKHFFRVSFFRIYSTAHGMSAKGIESC